MVNATLEDDTIQDATKTTKELLQELAVLRQRVGTLEAADVARQQALAALEESEARYQALVEGSLEGISIVRQGKRVFANQAYATMFGYDSPQELMGRNVMDCIAPHEHDRLRRDTAAFLRGEPAPSRYAYEGVTKDGRLIWVEALVAPVSWEGYTALQVTVQDITMRKRATEALHQAKVELERQVTERTAALYEANRHLMHEITERTQQEHQLRQQQDHLTRLAAKVVLAEEQERHRIAQGLHDQVGQLLAIATGTLDTVQAGEATGDLGRSLDTIRELVDQALQEVRSLTFTLSSPLLYTLGLEAALAHLGEQMGAQHGFRFQCATDHQPIPLSDTLRVMLYRAARELLGNVIKHAHARHVWMAVHRVGTHLHLTVHDDGVGFDSAASGTGFTPTGGFGLFSIRQQLEAIGGALEIDTAPGDGSRVRIVVPLECDHHI